MNAATLSNASDDLLRYINATPDLLSLLYDLDLMPEQLERPSKDWSRMMVVALYHRNRTISVPEPIA